MSTPIKVKIAYSHGHEVYTVKFIKVAFIGAGHMASEHAKAFSALQNVSLVGIFSRTRARAEQLAVHYPGMGVFESIEALYTNSLPDLVVVTVKELSMNSVASSCFLYPWTILLEKPAGYNLADATQILDAATRSGSNVYVALNRRAYSSTRIAMSRLSKLNGPRFIKVMDQQDQAAALNVYREPSEVARYYMFANSIHLIDYFRVFGRGEIIDVTPVTFWNPEKPGTVISRIEFSSGDLGLYEGVWDGPGPWAVSVVTPQERLEMRPLEQISVQLRGERKITNLDIGPDDSNYKPGLRFQAMQAVAAARGEPSVLPTISDSWQSMHLVARIFGFA